MIKKVLLIFTVLFLFNMNTRAASLCSYEEQTLLNQKAANVKATYEIVEETIKYYDMESVKEVFEISIFNITEDLYVVVKNNINDEEQTFTYNNTDNGVAKIKWDYAEDVTNFTIQVYTTNKTSCPDERYKTFYLTTPRYNEFYKREICQELSDFYLCQEYVTFGEISEEKFFKQLDSYRTGDVDDSGDNIKDNEEPTISDKIFEFLDDYKWYFVGGLVIILIPLLVIIKKRNKKQRDLGL